MVVTICALAGALAGIAGSAAAPSKSKSKTKAAQTQRSKGHFKRVPGFGPALGMGVGGPPVHSETVVPNANGDGFDTVTMDDGKLKSIDGSKLTITEGTDKATYGEPTVDVGSEVTVIRNHAKAALGDLKEGDFVQVIKGPKSSFVMAEDAAFRAQEQKERDKFGPHGHFRGRFFGPRPEAPDGPPPGMPPQPGAYRNG